MKHNTGSSIIILSEYKLLGLAIQIIIYLPVSEFKNMLSGLYK